MKALPSLASFFQEYFWQWAVSQLEVQSQMCKKFFSNSKLPLTLINSISGVKATGYLADNADAPQVSHRHQLPRNRSIHKLGPIRQRRALTLLTFWHPLCCGFSLVLCNQTAPTGLLFGRNVAHRNILIQHFLGEITSHCPRICANAESCPSACQV